MIGLFLHNAVSFDVIFMLAFAASAIGLVCALLVKTPPKPKNKRDPLSLDRFILKKGRLRHGRYMDGVLILHIVDAAAVFEDEITDLRQGFAS